MKEEGEHAALEQARRQLASVVRARRQALGMSQSQLARRVGCVPQYVYNLEAGVRAAPSFEMLVRLAEVLEVSPRAFYAAAPGKPAHPLVAFAAARGLSPRQVDRLIAVGRAMFQTSADKE